MPETARQRSAACAAYGVAKSGGSPRAFKGMSQSKRREWCKAKSLDKPKSKSASNRRSPNRSPNRSTSRGGRR